MAVITYQKTNRNNLTKNFTVNEFACHGSGCCSTVKIDSALADILQKIRDHFGKPVTINSGYRCATHNKNVGGASGSYHTKGMAADIAVQGVAPAEVAKYAESIGVLGIGLYETDKDGYFVHVDTRTTKSFWYGQAQAYRSTFGGAPQIRVKIEVRELSEGCTGEDVRSLQLLLAGRGFPCTSDGIFGAATKRAVQRYQDKVGLSADGIAGPATLSKLWGA